MTRFEFILTTIILCVTIYALSLWASPREGFTIYGGYPTAAQ